MRGINLCLSMMMGFATVAAHADTVQLFTVAGDFLDSTQPDCGTCTVGSYNGTLTIDTTAGTVLTGSLSATTPTGAYSVSGAPDSQRLIGSGGRYNLVDDYGISLGDFFLALDIPETLVGYTGGGICGFNDSGNGCGGLVPPLSTLSLDPGYYTYNGEVTPGAIVASPEPSSLILLGTGVLGVAGAVRRRLWRA